MIGRKGIERRRLQPSRRQFLKASIGATAAACWAPGCSSSGTEERVRRNVTEISASERDEYVEAVLLLKEIRSPFEPALSYYDQFVRFHQVSVLRSRLELGYSISHQCPAFLPWHRKLLLLFENAVRTHVRSDFCLPYWDWTDEASLDVVFSDDFMGPSTGDEDDNYALSTSALAKGSFPVVLTASQLTIDGTDFTSNCPFPFITRGPKTVDLPTADEVSALLEVETYDTEPYDLQADNASSFRNYLLGISPLQLHSLPHVWLGGQWDSDIWNGSFAATTSTFVGTMSALDCSPNDPVFFLHHCNVDRIWAAWEERYGAQYAPDSGWNQGWNRNDELYPYVQFRDNPEMMREGITNASMLDFRSLGYSYDDLLI